MEYTWDLEISFSSRNEAKKFAEIFDSQFKDCGYHSSIPLENINKYSRKIEKDDTALNLSDDNFLIKKES